MPRCWSAIAVVGCLLCSAPTIALAGQAGKSPVKVFILSGQSNMEGKGWASHIENQKDDPALAEDIPKLKRDGKWVVRDDVWITYPTNSLDGGPKSGKLTVGYGTHRHEKFGDEIGPEFGIGQALGNGLDNQVLLIKVAWGGKSVKKDFLPPSEGGPGENYTLLVKHVREELAKLPETFPDYDGKGYELAGLIWFQGFNDMIDGKQREEQYAGYTRRLAAMIRDLRKDLDAPNLPVVIGELGTSGLPARGAFQAAQAAVADLPEFKDRVQFVKTCEFYDTKAHELYEKNVWKDPDNKETFYRIAADRPYHYLGSGKTYYLMGKAMGQAMLELQD